MESKGENVRNEYTENLPQEILNEIEKEAEDHARPMSGPYSTHGAKYKQFYKNAVLPYAVRVHALTDHAQKLELEIADMERVTTFLTQQVKDLTDQLNKNIAIIAKSNDLLTQMLQLRMK